MRLNGWLFATLLAGWMGGAATVMGAVTAKEDLRSCKLPCGEVVVPVSGTAEAASGEFVRLSDGKFVSAKTVWQLRKPDDVEGMRSRHEADLAFLPDDKGTLWAISGRIVDMGARYLYEAAAMKLDRPEVIPGNSKRPAGIIREIQEGRTYLLETTDGKFALLRVLDVGKAGATVQYIYQPSGAVSFDVPQGAMLDLNAGAIAKEPAGAKPPAVPTPSGLPAATQAAPTVEVTSPPELKPAPGLSISRNVLQPVVPSVLEPPFDTHMKQRAMMIESRMKVLKAPAKTQPEIDRKVDAISQLVTMHAEEATDEMARQVAFLNTRGGGKEFQDSMNGVHPCFAGLKKMGKAGSDAAVKELRAMDLGGEGMDSATYRAGLLSLVIRATEGDDVGLYILKKERDKATDEKRRAVLDALVEPKVQTMEK